VRNLESYVPSKDAEVVSAIKEAGGIVFGYVSGRTY
jgi:mandelamide amidase